MISGALTFDAVEAVCFSMSYVQPVVGRNSASPCEISSYVCPSHAQHIPPATSEKAMCTHWLSKISSIFVAFIPT